MQSLNVNVLKSVHDHCLVSEDISVISKLQGLIQFLVSHSSILYILKDFVIVLNLQHR